VLDHAHRLDQKKSPADLLETNALMRLLLAVFFADFDWPQTHNTLHGLTRFQNVLEYIRQNLHRPITIVQLAEAAKLNPTYFSNLFSRYMGISPIQYINKRRIEESQRVCCFVLIERSIKSPVPWAFQMNITSPASLKKSSALPPTTTANRMSFCTGDSDLMCKNRIHRQRRRGRRCFRFPSRKAARIAV
jgi:hypothetical protein